MSNPEYIEKIRQNDALVKMLTDGKISIQEYQERIDTPSLKPYMLIKTAIQYFLP